MATATQFLSPSNMSIGGIFALALSAIRNNPVVMLSLGLLFGAVPTLLITYVSSMMMDAQGNELSVQSWVVFALTMILTTCVSTLPQAFLTRPVIAQSDGRRAGFRESVWSGLQVMLPILVIGFVYAVGVISGLVLIIIPGFLLMAAWSIVAPVYVQERGGILRSFRRSQELTRGVRWKIIGLLLVFYAIYLSKEGAIQFLSGEWDSTVLTAAYSNPTFVVLSGLSETLLTTFWCAVLAALYVELRECKDGPGTDRLQKIFA